MPSDEEDMKQPMPWQRASLEMVAPDTTQLLFEDAISVHASDLSDAVYGKLKNSKESAPERPLLEMLASILGMHETPSKTPPFSPVLIRSDGYRSAAPDDFAGPFVEVIVGVLEYIEHPVARARLAHLAWLLERRRKDQGLTALHAYIEILDRLDDRRLEARGERGILGVASRDLLKMAFSVCRGLGRPNKEQQRLNEILANLLRRAEAEDDGLAVRLFSDLALEECAVPPEDIAEIVECLMARTARDAGPNEYPAQMWLLAARARKHAKDDNAAHVAKINAAEYYAAMSETFAGRPQGAILAAHWMEVAIATLHGVPDVRERRQELRHRLVDMQGAIRDDLAPISHSTDISDLVEKMRKQFLGLPLDEAFRQLTVVPGIAPDPDALVENACRSSAEHPLASLFATSHMDAAGKTIARSPSGGFGSEEISTESLEPTIMQAEGVRRGIAARGAIDVARLVIMAEHRVSEEVLLNLVRHSPAIPLNLVHTTARGFTRWFQGDMISALYILTPMLEGILRHLLKQHGHDVTTMDDATKTQEDRTITSLYDAMRTELDAILGRALTEDIRRTFLSKLGPSLRHGVAHALLSDGAPYSDDATYACWLVWMIVIWPLLPHWDELTGEILINSSQI